MYTIILTALDGTVTPFGPYRSVEKAQKIREQMTDPESAEYYPPDEFGITEPLVMARYDG
jgi:hypothetical protein